METLYPILNTNKCLKNSMHRKMPYSKKGKNHIRAIYNSPTDEQLFLLLLPLLQISPRDNSRQRLQRKVDRRHRHV